jgi:hypothetical protein
MSGRRAFLFACLVLAATSAWAQGSKFVTPGGRVGVIDLMLPDVTHYHVGRVQTESFLRTYRGEWTTAELVAEPLMGELAKAGFEPVALAPSDRLRREKQGWIVSSPRAVRLPRAMNRELEEMMSAQDLQALIIVAPGPNSDSEPVEGSRMRRLPGYIQGWGFSTSDEPGGIEKPVIFNLTQMLLIVRTDDGPRLDFRDWGANYLYEWPNFTPGPDLKALSGEELAKLRPVYLDVMKRQIARVLPRLKP